MKRHWHPKRGVLIQYRWLPYENYTDIFDFLPHLLRRFMKDGGLMAYSKKALSRNRSAATLNWDFWNLETRTNNLTSFRSQPLYDITLGHPNLARSCCQHTLLCKPGTLHDHTPDFLAAYVSCHLLIQVKLL